jgi:hypothetical protein
VIPAWGKSFKDFALVLAAAHSSGTACLLNPVVGPEVVTGSTRMKSGSATKIILEIICSLAITCASSASLAPHDIENQIFHLITLYCDVVTHTYASTELTLPSLIANSSHFLRGLPSQSPSPSNSSAPAPLSAGRILYASDVICAGRMSLPPPALFYHSHRTHTHRRHGSA